MANSRWSFVEYVTDRLEPPRLGISKAPTLWPSEASCVNSDGVLIGACRRKVFFRYLKDLYAFRPEGLEHWEELVAFLNKVYIEPDAKALWIFASGNLFEDLLVEKAKETGVYIAREVPVYYRDLNVSGRIDIVVINPHTGKNTIIECKSIYGIGADFSIGKFLKSGFRHGSPKESHLMQVALYQNLIATEDWGDAQLVYGDRGSGYHGDYFVRIVDDKILYRQQSPVAKNDFTDSKLTISGILKEYAAVPKKVFGTEIPERDFALQYSEEKIQELYEAGSLNKTDTQRHEKWLRYKQNGGRSIKPVSKGDWNCSYCPFKKACYKQNGECRDL